MRSTSDKVKEKLNATERFLEKKNTISCLSNLNSQLRSAANISRRERKQFTEEVQAIISQGHKGSYKTSCEDENGAIKKEELSQFNFNILFINLFTFIYIYQILFNLLFIHDRMDLYILIYTPKNCRHICTFLYKFRVTSFMQFYLYMR